VANLRNPAKILTVAEKLSVTASSLNARLSKDGLLRLDEKVTNRMKMKHVSSTIDRHRFCRGQAVFKWISLLAILGLFALGGLLFAEKTARQKEVVLLREQYQQLQQEKEQLEQFRGAAQEVERLRLDNAELVKLRGEVAALRPLQKQQQQLQAELQQLRGHLQQAQQTRAEVAALRNQNQQLQQNQQTQVEAQVKVQADACIYNLKAIEGAKGGWALEQKKTGADVPTDADLFGPDKYLGQKPACPAGGVYTLGPVQVKPTCSIPGHALP
jgi:DNA repair exonuclease SbcCD ATPase subunit